jgi:hypothetical protein
MQLCKRYDESTKCRGLRAGADAGWCHKKAAASRNTQQEVSEAFAAAEEARITAVHTEQAITPAHQNTQTPAEG